MAPNAIRHDTASRGLTFDLVSVALPLTERGYTDVVMLYYVVSFTDGGETCKGLHSTTDEDYAYDICDEYSEKYPHGYFDVFTEDEYDSAITVG